MNEEEGGGAVKCVLLNGSVEQESCRKKAFGS